VLLPHIPSRRERTNSVQSKNTARNPLSGLITRFGEATTTRAAIRLPSSLEGRSSRNGDLT
jgi:hypothetical protein